MKCPPLFKLFCFSCDKGYEFGIDGFELYERLVGSYEGYEDLNIKTKYKPICDNCWIKHFDPLWINDGRLKKISKQEISPYDLYGNELSELYYLISDFLGKKI